MGRTRRLHRKAIRMMFLRMFRAVSIAFPSLGWDTGGGSGHTMNAFMPHQICMVLDNAYDVIFFGFSEKNQADEYLRIKVGREAIALLARTTDVRR